MSDSAQCEQCRNRYRLHHFPLQSTQSPKKSAYGRPQRYATLKCLYRDSVSGVWNSRRGNHLISRFYRSTSQISPPIPFARKSRSLQIAWRNRYHKLYLTNLRPKTRNTEITDAPLKFFDRYEIIRKQRFPRRRSNID